MKNPLILVSFWDWLQRVPTESDTFPLRRLLAFQLSFYFLISPQKIQSVDKKVLRLRQVSHPETTTRLLSFTTRNPLASALPSDISFPESKQPKYKLSRRAFCYCTSTAIFASKFLPFHSLRSLAHYLSFRIFLKSNKYLLPKLLYSKLHK